MSKFEVKVYKLIIEEHPNADRLELARVGDYRSIVGKGQFKTGDFGAYIPEGSIVPELALKRMDLEGKLAGKQKNRVKAVKLRGILSQGLIYPVEFRENVLNAGTRTMRDIHCITTIEDGPGHFVEEGDDVADWLSITKWEPPIPICMQGEVYNAFGKTLIFDIENIKKFPDIFKDGEEVCITEKLHGTFCLMGFHPEVDTPVVTSKGLSKKGLAFKFNEANKDNLYVRAFEATKNENSLTIIDRVNQALNFSKEAPVYILGEVFGRGIQDLTYGENHPQFRVFDIYVGEPGQGDYHTPDELALMAEVADFITVPILYVGKYSQEIVNLYTNGKESVSGKESHVREGIVIRPLKERRDPELGRVFLKSVSEAYILRKGNKVTEFN